MAKKRYKLGTGSNPTTLKFNHCSRFINQQIFAVDDLEIGTIEINSNENLNKRNIFNEKQGDVIDCSLNEKPQFEPAFMIRTGRDAPKIIKENNLTFVSIVKDGFIVTKKITNNPLHEFDFILKSSPSGTNLIIDKNNKRLRLIGYKTSSEWVKFEKLPLYIRNKK
jgi:hypothetical protein